MAGLRLIALLELDSNLRKLVVVPNNSVHNGLLSNGTHTLLGLNTGLLLLALKAWLLLTLKTSLPLLKTSLALLHTGLAMLKTRLLHAGIAIASISQSRASCVPSCCSCSS
jgi:hypothetical protein